MSGSVIRASAVLRRRVKLGEEGRTASGGDGDDAYWAATPRLYDFSKHDELIKREQEQPAPAPEPELVPGPPPCLLTSLIQSGGVGWALRKRVRFIDRHPARRGRRGGADRAPIAAAVVETLRAEVVVKEADEESSSNGKTRSLAAEQEEESDQDERTVTTTEKRKRKARRGLAFTKRRRPKKTPPPPKEVNAVAEDSAQDESKVDMTEKKRNRLDEAESEESGRDESKVVAVETVMRRNRKAVHGRVVITEPPKKTRRVEAEVAKAEVAVSRRAMVERWTAERYAAGEASLLGILRDHGARASQPMPRGKLRQEMRKHVGDTGLLDHLLKHVAGKVAPGGAERMRRRHNADGAMVYWLEPAGLEDLRRKAGVEDPYWVPPPGWKPGDPVSPDACALKLKRQVEMLSAEFAGVKRQMEQIMKASHQDHGTLNKEMKSEICIAEYHQPYQEDYHCRLKANGTLEKQILSLEEKYEIVTRANGKLEEEVLFLKEKYEAVLEKNSRLEEQMAHLCTSFLSLKEDMLLLNAGEHHMIDPSTEDDCKDGNQEGNAGGGAPENAAGCAGDGMATASSSGGGSGKRTSRKCSVRICKPQRTFQWPDAQPSSPVTPTTAGANLAPMEDGLHGYMMAGVGGGGLPPTPPSVSSTNAASSKLPLLPPPPPPPLATSPSKDILQAPCSGLELQLRRHTDTSSSSSAPAPCGATVRLPEGKKKVLSLSAAAAGGSVGTELALATCSY